MRFTRTEWAGLLIGGAPVVALDVFWFLSPLAIYIGWTAPALIGIVVGSVGWYLKRSSILGKWIAIGAVAGTLVAAVFLLFFISLVLGS